MTFDPKQYMTTISGIQPPEAALLKLIEILRGNLSSFTTAEFDASVALVAAFLEKHLKLQFDVSKRPSEGGRAYFDRVCQSLEPQVKARLHEKTHKRRYEELVGQFDEALEIYASGHPKFGYAKLDAAEKKLCHEHLSAIREIIECSQLDAEKRNAILKRLNDLSAEVDKDYTSVDGFAALAGDCLISYVNLAEKARPAIEITRKLLTTVFSRSAVDQGIVLPPAQDLPLLGEAARTQHRPENEEGRS